VIDRLWASWRSEYVLTAASKVGADARDGRCVFCALAEMGVNVDSGVIHLDEVSMCVLNAYPYGSGHLLILPRRHESHLLSLTEQEATGLWATARRAVAALESAYRPGGINLGANLGEAAGAGIPAHLHLHALPRWAGDTNFMTSIAEIRVLPESLETTWEKVTAAWPSMDEADPITS
jgi:ATP adenylyltransferase